MYVEGERTQSYLLDIWYVCRERTYTILFIIYVYTQVYLERDWICDMTHSFICILVMHAFICVPWWFMYVCIHIHVKMHLSSDACVWQDSFFHVTMNHVHVSDDSDTHAKYYRAIYSWITIHFCFFVLLNPYPRWWICIIFSSYLCICIMKANTHSWIHICTYTRICRERCNLWHVTFLRVKFLTHVFTRMYSYVWHDGSYIHSCSGRDAFVITFFSCVVRLFDTRDNESFLCYDGVYLRFCSTVYPHRCMSTYWEKVCKYLFM